MRNILLVTLVVLGFISPVRSQNVAIKTNSLYWAALASNLGIEMGITPKMTFEFAGAYKPWNLKTENWMRFWFVQPEARYWFCERFEGHFLGLHLHGGQYYACWKHKIYDGYLAGGGFTYGYNWIISPRWNLELLVGVGYARLWYKKRPDLPCVKCFKNESKNYVGPTKIALTFSYMF